MDSRLNSERLHSLATLLTRVAPRVLQSMPTASLAASIRAPYGLGVGVAVGVGVGLTTTTVVEVLVPWLGSFL
jgi:hypothetical protein